MGIREGIRDDNDIPRPNDSCSASPADGGGETMHFEGKESVECKVQGW